MEEVLDKENARFRLEIFYDELSDNERSEVALKAIISNVRDLTNHDAVLSERQWATTASNMHRHSLRALDRLEFTNICFTIAMYLNSCKRTY
ncbi:MAG: hypothetical protein M3Q64_02410 [bacterium]|nr:hypothetical protein [bacterium]